MSNVAIDYVLIYVVYLEQIDSAVRNTRERAASWG